MHSRVSKYHGWLIRNSAKVLLAVFLIGAGAAALAARLELRTAFVELLPSNDPGVIALQRTQRRMGDMSLLLIGISSPDYAANLRYAEALTQRLRALPPNVINLAAYEFHDLRGFFKQNKWLFVSEADLEAIRDRLHNEIGKRKNPLFVSLEDEEPLDKMENRLERKNGLDERFPDGVFASKDGQYVWIAALPPGGLFVEHAGEALFAAAHRLIKENPPAAFQPQMRAEVAGPIATGIANRDAVVNDLIAVTTTCIVIVVLSIGFYFRRLRAVPLTGIPAAVGAAVAFAVAELAFGYLTESTAFLGSIIVGNGINYAIVLMSRYEEQRARGAAPDEALGQAIAGTWRGTLVASIAASAAYASLMVTSFRGFYHFGVMGAVGALSCWLATYTVLPALLWQLDGRGRAGRGRLPRSPVELGPLARFIGRHGAAVSVGFIVLGLGGVVGLRYFLKDPFEYNFRKLSIRTQPSQETQRFNDSLESLFGRWPSPTIVLADSIDEVDPIKQTIRRQDHDHPGPEVVGDVVTIYDLLPGTPAAQQRKLDIIAQIRKLTHDPALSSLNEKEKADLAKVDPPEGLHALAPAELPPLARRPFTETDGTLGRVVLVYPPERGMSVWDGRALLRIAGVLQYLHLPSGKVIETSGSAVVFGAMIRSVVRDGPIATAASLIAVLIIVILTIRPARAALVALGTLLLGVVMMVGAAGWAEVRVTFLNFIALPITFGIGAEYALNVITRYREERNVLRAIVSTGAAVALCSWTTIVGYGSLLAARNRALQGFGAMAILGEISCLSAAIVALPAFLTWRQARALYAHSPPRVEERARAADRSNPDPALLHDDSSARTS
jgi:predicted exporter